MLTYFMDSYLFVHQDIENKASRTLDDYWKGKIENIKIHPTLPSSKNILLKVRWFWSRKDVQKQMKGKLSRNLSLYIRIPESLRTVLITALRILNSMAKQELFASDSVSVVCSSSVEGEGWVRNFLIQTLG